MRRKLPKAASKVQGPAAAKASNPDPSKSPDALNALFVAALNFHKSGQLDKATEAYDSIFQQDPTHADALHWRGVIDSQQSNYTDAIDRIERSIGLSPENATFHLNLGNALSAVGRLTAAMESYQSAIRFRPDYAQAHLNLGNMQKQTGDLGAALSSYHQAIQINPTYGTAYFNCGNAHRENNEMQPALDCYDKAIEITPGDAEAYANRGNTLRDMQQLDSALASYDQAILLRPGYAMAYSNRGLTLHDLKRYAEALISFDEAIAIKTDYSQAYSNRGNTLRKLQQNQAALASYDKAIDLNPAYADAFSNRGVLLNEMSQPQDALLSFDQAIAINPAYAEAYSNRGMTLQRLNRLDDALDSYDRAISLKPRYAEAFSNRGLVLHELRRLDEALLSFNEAILIEPENIGAHWNKALTLILCGKLKLGFELYEWRWSEDEEFEIQKKFTAPLWLGQTSIAGKTILLHAEQGLGDTLQFCRYARLIVEMGATPVLQVQAGLVKLITTLLPDLQVIALGDTALETDFHCPLLSLPLAFNTLMGTIPAAPAYLSSHADKRELWEQRLGEKTKLRVGVVWQGSTVHKNDRNRSLALRELLARLPDAFEYVCLQAAVSEADLQTLNTQERITQLTDPLEDFTDTAAVCDLMDLIITVDTSVAHLAGALGKPTWTLLSHVPDWRWFLDRTDTPWYPSMTLYRQDHSRCWNGVLKNMEADLQMAAAKQRFFMQTNTVFA